MEIGAETYLQCPDPGGCQSGPERLCRAMGKQVFLRHKKLEGQLAGTNRILRISFGDP